MATTATQVLVSDAIDSPIAVSTEKAQRLFELLREKIGAGETVELAFTGIRNTITAFLNTAIGQLYGIYSDEVLSEQLIIIGGSAEIDEMLRMSIENAKRYFRDTESYRQAYRHLEELDAPRDFRR